MMNRKSLIMTVAFALAFLVLLSAWWTGRSALTVNPHRASIATNEPLLPPHASVTSPSSTPTSSFSSASSMIPGGVRQYVLETRTRKGQLIQVIGQTLDPLLQDRWQMGAPIVRIYLNPKQTIQITAEQGTIFAPGRQPRSGQLQGNVQLSLLEMPQNPEAGDSSPHTLLTLNLQDARFDVELGQIDTDGPVSLAHSRFAFDGQGLSLTYNQLRKRIEHLEIIQGKVLRLKTNLPASSAQKASPANPASKKHGAGTSAADASASAPVFYQTQLLDNVQVQNPDTRITASQMNIVFTLEERMSPSSSSAVSSASSGASNSTSNASSANASSSVFTADDQDVLITWTGRLVMEPMAQPPTDLSEIDDAMLTLIGSPVQITTKAGEQISAATAEYLLSRALLRLTGSRDPSPQPVVLQTPRLGTLRAPQILIDQTKGIGSIIGSGILRGPNTAASSTVEEGDSSMQRITELASADLPPGLSISWSQRLDLSFYSSASEKNVSGSSSTPSSLYWRQMQSIQTASFQGDVQVSHPALSLSADSLSTTLSAPSRGRQLLQNIAASGKVQTRVYDSGNASNTNGAVAIRADQLQVQLTPDGQNNPQPSRLLAQGNVHAISPKHRIDAGVMQVFLQPALSSATTGGALSSYPSTSLTPSRLVAENNVRISVENPAAVLTGQQVTADILSDQLQISGTPQQAAQLQQNNAVLTGRQILLNQRNQTVDVPSAGTFTLSQPGATSSANPTTLTTTWTQAMHLDAKAGQADFTGEVVSQTQSAHDSSRLFCKQLTLTFDLSSAASAANVSSRSSSFQQLKTISAYQDVTFQAENRLDPPANKLATRLTLQGPQLQFDNPRQNFTITGQGKMLLEDYRPSSASDQTAANAASPTSSIRFAGGRGATLFTWEQQLLFNLASNDMTMHDKVRMTHRPADNNDVMQLDCSRLTADFSSTTTLSGWFASSNNATPAANASVKPELKTVTALGPILLRAAPRTIRTDKLVYNQASQSILLQADPGHMTQLSEDNKPQPFAAEGFKWDLAHNRLEIIGLGPARIPTR